MTTLPNLLWLRSFEAAGRLGSFTAAGTELGLTQAAVSSHVSSLEGRLGHALLNRTTRKVTLTESGRAYLPSVHKALQDLARSTEALFGGRATGTVTIRAPISAAALVIAPALAAFRTDHPGISIRLLSAIWADTALESGIDIEIRLGDGAWPGCRTVPLGEDFVVPVCAPEHAGHIRSQEDLIARPRAHILGFDNHWSRYFQDVDISPEMQIPSATFDTTLAAVEWVSSGGGVALIFERAARRLAEAGRLSIPFETRIPLGQTHYLIQRDNARAKSGAVSLTEAWLRELFGN